MNKRKILTMAMALCMVAILAVGGTLAYFTDYEEKTNTMTIGNVQIDVEELSKDPDTGKYVPYTDDLHTLYPITDAKGMALFNKMAYTFNESPSEDAAYIRNIVLVENNTGTFCEDTDCCLNGIHYAYSGTDYTFDGKKIHGSTNKVLGEMTVNDVEYQVVVFTAADEKAIPYGEALEALNSVWMDAGIEKDAIAGWGEDNKVTIKVLAQGIQADNLTHAEAMAALGEINAENLEAWFDDKDSEDAVINNIFSFGQNNTENNG